MTSKVSKLVPSNPTADGIATRGYVDERLPMPLYHQVYLVLRNKILTGEYGFGALLPSEQETSETFGVSRITANLRVSLVIHYYKLHKMQESLFVHYVVDMDSVISAG